MSKFLFMLLLCLVPMEAQYSVNRRYCSTPRLENGHVRMRQRGRIARFVCFDGYDLVGDKYATCRGRQWDVPMPVCVRAGCKEPSILNAFMMPSHHGAWLHVFCYPGYKGSTAMYCDGQNWNGSLPTCVPDSKETKLACDFESPDLCGWTQDERHDFDWTRINKKTPSAFLFTGPAFDHTFGEGKSGYYMYIESSSKAENDTARLISPVYSGGLEKNGCFSFFYHMYGKATGGLRVYQIPENQKEQILNENDKKNQYLLFEKWGNQGDTWYRNVSKLRDVSDNFQIVIEGVRGSSFTSDIAIDDVAILQGSQCDDATAMAVTPSEDILESCAFRCLEQATHRRGCGCSMSCISDGDCCADFIDLCVFNPNSANTDDDEVTTSKNASDLPRTEKLIAPTTQSTSTITTTTTPKPTTTTPKPTTTTPKPTTTTPKTTTTSTTITTTAKPVKTTTKLTTVKITTKFVKLMNVTTAKPIGIKKDIDKARTEEAIKARKIVKEKPAGTSSTAVGVLVLLLCACAAGAALAARGARGRAALARLRGRASGDSEVRYLTGDQD